MRRSTAFWGAVLVLIGILLLLNNFGLLGNISVWGLLWPLLLIMLGIWFLSGNLFGARSHRIEEASIPLQEATRARIHLRHGAGRLNIDAGTDPSYLASGSFGGGLDYRARRISDALEVEMRPRGGGFQDYAAPWNWGPRDSLNWSLHLNRDIHLWLDLETGASDTHIDLTDLKVTDLQLRTGASSTDITLPAHVGRTQVTIEAGAASLAIHIPSGVAARVRAEGALSNISVDTGRFPQMGDIYQSPDFETAPNKADVNIRAGVGSVRVE